jgi:hypothetical protein
MSAGLFARYLLDRGVARAEALSTVAKHVLESLGEEQQPLCAVAGSLGLAWLESAFSRIEPTHKLAASLMSTSVSEELHEHINPPWRTFCVTVPHGILPIIPRFLNFETTHIFMHTRPDGGVSSYGVSDGGIQEIVEHGSMRGLVLDAKLLGSFEGCNTDDLLDAEQELILRRSRAYNRLVLGCCLELATLPNLATATSSARQRLAARPKSAEPRCWTLKLRRPVQVDAREHLRNYLSDISARSITVQTLVRGHWRAQPHGPGRTLRRPVHIEPFWRGPVDAPIALRPHLLGNS